ncbi:MAG TPA: hypothetical protein VLJ39_08345 [Tepidisphaeraceae bacterium]|nr:hypothetical protein [Tepidisphaeraceae bacterium]
MARAGSFILAAGIDVISVSPDVAAAVINERGDVVLDVQTIFRRQVLLEAGSKAQ